MFKDETVLVLGAGASCGYGFPTGEKLIDDIITTIRDVRFKEPISGQNKWSLYTEAKYKNLRDNLEFYDPLSIDAFLSQFFDQEIVIAGKAMIAYQLMMAENENLLKRRVESTGQPTDKKNWYRFLHNAITVNAKPDNLLKGELKLKIITFNYDVSLDYYLVSRFNKTPLFKDKSEVFINKLGDNIIHVYGQLGSFFKNSSNQKKSSFYREVGTYGAYRDDRALNFAEGDWKDFIHVINENRAEQVKANAEKAKTWLSNAKHVFFLGYGFHDENNNLLELRDSCLDAKNIFCTNFQNVPIIDKKIKDLFALKKGSKVYSKSIGQSRDVEDRNPHISTKSVYDALSEDFSLLQE